MWKLPAGIACHIATRYLTYTLFPSITRQQSQDYIAQTCSPVRQVNIAPIGALGKGGDKIHHW